MSTTQIKPREYAVALVNITDGTVSGHKAGCADLKRGQLRKHADDAWELTVQDKADAWFSYNVDFLAESGEDSAYEIQWAACAKHVPEGDKHARYVSAFSEETPADIKQLGKGLQDKLTAAAADEERRGAATDKLIEELKSTTPAAAAAAAKKSTNKKTTTTKKGTTVKSTTKKSTASKAKAELNITGKSITAAAAAAAKKTAAAPAATIAPKQSKPSQGKSYTVPKGYTLKYPHGGYDLLKRIDAKGAAPAWWVTCNAHGQMTAADSAKGGDALGRKDALGKWCKGDHKSK